MEARTISALNSTEAGQPYETKQHIASTKGLDSLSYKNTGIMILYYMYIYYITTLYTLVYIETGIYRTYIHWYTYITNFYIHIHTYEVFYNEPVEASEADVFLSGALLCLHQARCSVDADDQTPRHLRVERAAVPRLLHAQDALDPCHHL